MSQDVLDRLVAESKIRELLYLRARATDRVDLDLALSCYHEGATERYEDHAGDAREFVRGRLSNPRADIAIMFHSLSNILIDFRSIDAAFAETYYELRFQTIWGEPTDHLVGGRYLDEVERIDGIWAIRHRETVVDFRMSEPCRTRPAIVTGAHALSGRRGGDDPLYRFLGRGAASR